MSAPRFWGWHRLSERSARRLVADAGIAPDDLVVDIGAGTGAITAALVAAGARVVAFELHPGRAAQLRARFNAASVTVVQADAADMFLPRQPFRVVANPPFAITAAIVRRLVGRGSRLTRADLVVPRWTAARWEGVRGGYVVATGPPVRRDAFRPPAPMDTTVMQVVRL